MEANESAAREHAGESAPALQLSHVTLRRFRNLRPLDLAPGPTLNVVSGPNGAGKSNLLEALHYLASLRSFRGARVDDLIALGEDEATLEARLLGHAAPRRLAIALGRSKSRQLQLDLKRPRSLSTWQNAVRAVAFHPAVMSLSMGAPLGRRAFLDETLSQLDPTYASALSAYEKALKSRNRLLKQDRIDTRSIRSFDPIMAEAGAILTRTRAELSADLAPQTERAFEAIMGDQMPLRLRYAASVEGGAQALREALERSFPKDRARGFTTLGPHQDDLLLSAMDRPSGEARRTKHHASQGQHRAIVLALKVAELEVLRARGNKVPLLLLDDVSSELDRARNARFFALLAAQGGQVFLTTTHPEYVVSDRARVDFLVESGRVSRL